MVVAEYVVKVDTTNSPKAIDLTAAEGPLKGRTIPCIYQVNGNELRICNPGLDFDKPRPTGFAAKEGSGRRLTIYRRMRCQE